MRKRPNGFRVNGYCGWCAGNQATKTKTSLYVISGAGEVLFSQSDLVNWTFKPESKVQKWCGDKVPSCVDVDVTASQDNE